MKSGMEMSARIVIVAVSLVFTTGCQQEKSPPSKPAQVQYMNYDAEIKFQDEVTPQETTADDLTTLTFTDKDGNSVALKDFLGEKNLILVITRGYGGSDDYGGSICPYCSTQVSRLISSYSKLKELNSEVVVIYPLQKSDDGRIVEEFVKRAVGTLPDSQKQVPFPLLLDVELKAVDALGIRKDLSKPATYIFDTQGKLRFTYVGNSLADRPSVKALVEQLSLINAGSKS